MAFKNRDRKDFNAGIMYIVIGGFFAIIAAGVPGVPEIPGYAMGSAVRMGPAYFPVMLGSILVLIGVIVLVRSFVLHGEPLPRTNWRPLAFILGSVFAFAFLLGTAGLVAASFALMFISAFGGWDFRWKEQLINAVAMTATNVGVFYYALGLPFKLWPWS